MHSTTITELSKKVAAQRANVARAERLEFDGSILKAIEDRKIVLCGFDPVTSAGHLYEFLRNGYQIIGVADDERAGDKVFRRNALSSFELATKAFPPAAILLNCSTHNRRAYQTFENIAGYLDKPIVNVQRLAYLSRQSGIAIDLTIDPTYYVKSIVDNLDRYLSVLPLLEDDRSREILLQVLLGRITIDYNWFWSAYSPVEDMYFPDFFDYRDDEVFVDAGAFDGTDTTRFLRRNRGHCKAVYLFEIAPSNLTRIAKTLDQFDGMDVRQRLHTIPSGLWDKNDQLPFIGEGLAAFLADVRLSDKPVLQAGTCEVIDLDSVVESATLIKLEIEGAEMRALRGARGIIRKCRPNMAISAYHLSDDIVDIIQFLSDLDLGYQFRLRHHWGSDIRTIIYAATKFKTI